MDKGCFTATSPKGLTSSCHPVMATAKVDIMVDLQSRFFQERWKLQHFFSDTRYSFCPNSTHMKQQSV
ncbi:hypothetical protein JOB18_004967 [Solea senegalensis]|uniref:Uncharacterized protein n=1 Tax=Solea senegalensis TaxID=28829 RepID=A0AAV6T3D4_SOLSE|nr:hypothetical protein JOB18_004967 [Solea senegalensis]